MHTDRVEYDTSGLNTGYPVIPPDHAAARPAHQYGYFSPALVRSYSSRIALVAKGLVAPLYHRLRLGEAGLFVVNAALAVAYHSAFQAIGLATISILCLLTLYLFNDIVDARDDQHNPKKDPLIAATYIRERRLFLACWWALTGLVVGAAAWLDPRAGAWVVAVSAINAGYSLVCKRVPILDVVWVGLWGAAYAAIVTPATAWVVLIGAMTSVCHVYQTSEDREADAANGFATSAMLARSRLSIMQAVLTVILVASAWTLHPGVAALTLAAFLPYWVAWQARPRTAWILAKAHFTAVCAYLLMIG